MFMLCLMREMNGENINKTFFDVDVNENVFTRFEKYVNVVSELFVFEFEIFSSAPL